MAYLKKDAIFRLVQPIWKYSKTRNMVRTLSSEPLQGIPNTKISRVVEEYESNTDPGFTTSSREHFSVVYPGLYQKQEYHMNQLKAGIPVHRSGKTANFSLTSIYSVTALISVYTFYCTYQYLL